MEALSGKEPAPFVKKEIFVEYFDRFLAYLGFGINVYV
jgi:hypothetical protein